MLASITVDDLVEQMAFYELEPFGSLVEERRFGQLVSMTANVNRNADVKREPWTPEDFMPSLMAEKARQDDEAQRARRSKLTAAQAAALFDAQMFGVTPDTIPRSRKPRRVQ